MAQERLVESLWAQERLDEMARVSYTLTNILSLNPTLDIQ